MSGRYEQQDYEPYEPYEADGQRQSHSALPLSKAALKAKAARMVGGGVIALVALFIGYQVLSHYDEKLRQGSPDEVQELVARTATAQRAYHDKHDRYTASLAKLATHDPKVATARTPDSKISLDVALLAEGRGYRVTGAVADAPKKMVFVLGRRPDGSVLESCQSPSGCQDDSWFEAWRSQQR